MKTITLKSCLMFLICCSIFALDFNSDGILMNDSFYAINEKGLNPSEESTDLAEASRVDNLNNLSLASECSFYPGQRRWRVTNPNQTTVQVRWRVVGTNETAVYNAQPGKTYFFTTDAGGSNTAKLYWMHGDDLKCVITASTNELCDICEKDNIVEEDRYKVLDASSYSIILPNLLCENEDVKFTFDTTDPGFMYIIDDETNGRNGFVHILGQARITENAVCGDKDYSDVVWDMDFWFRPSNPGEIVEPRLVSPGQNTSDWRLWALFSGKILNKSNSNEQISFIRMTNNNFGFQIGTGANNQNSEYGASAWFKFIVELNDEPMWFSGNSGHGSLNVNLTEACEDVEPPVVCDTYTMFYTDTRTGIVASEFSKIQFSGTDATLVPFATRNYGAHLSYDGATNTLYAINSNGSAIEKVDPETGASLGFIPLSGLNTIRCNAFKDGFIYLASQNQNRIVKVDPNTGSYTVIAADVPVAGGDLVFIGDDLYLVTRTGNRMMFIDQVAGTATFVANIPAGVNGVAQNADGTILMANDNASIFSVLNTSGAVIGSFNIIKDGVSYELNDGDLAAGCTTDVTPTDPEAGCFASLVMDYTPGLTSSGAALPANRSDASKALFAPDKQNGVDGFVSLGIGGSITLELEGAIFDVAGVDFTVYETSFSGDVCSGASDETAKIEISSNGTTFISAGEFCRDAQIDIAASGLAFITHVRITDLTTGSGDGYDVDGIQATNSCDDTSNIFGCVAEMMVTYLPGLTSNGSAIAADRMDATKALGTPDKANQADGFVSLGIGGSLEIELSGAIYNEAGIDLIVYETSFSGDDCNGSNDERAEILLSQDGILFVSAGVFCRDAEIDLEGLGLIYVTSVKIIDRTTGNGDGYDVDGIEGMNACREIPTNTPEEVCYGAFVIENSYQPGLKNNGQPITNPDRLDPSKALGVPEDDDSLNFVSLGYGGEIIIGFDGAVINNIGNDIQVFETTYNDETFASYPESADVYVSMNGFEFYKVGTAYTNESAEFDISSASVFLPFITQVKLIDTTPVGSLSDDAYDFDGIIALTGCTSLDTPSIAALLSTETKVALAPEFSLYPVPANTTLNIRLSGQTANNVSYEIVSILGQAYSRGQVEVNAGKVDIKADISNLADGTYFVRIHSGGTIISKQFVKASR